MDAVESAPRAPSPLPVIIVTTALLGFLAFLLISLAGDARSEGFIEFAAILAALVYLLTFVNIKLGLASLILCIGLSPEIAVGGVDNFRFEDFLVPALVAAWFLQSLKSRQDLVPMVIKGPFVGYLAAAALSCLIGLSFGNVKAIGSLTILAKNVEYLLIFLVLLNNIRTYREFKAFVIFALLVSVASSMSSAVGFIAGEGTRRLEGPLGERANIYGGYLVLHIGILIGLFLQAVTVRGRVISVVALLALLYSLLFTFSRTSYAALALGVTIFAVLKHRRLLGLVVLALLLLPLIAPDEVFSRAATITTVVTEGGPESWQARVAAWEDATTRIIASPFLGNGLGSIRFGDVDNEYVRVAVDMGILGLGLLFWLLARLGLTVNRLYDHIPGPSFSKGYAAGYFIAFLSIMIHCSGATSLSSIRTMESFMVLTALAIALWVNRETWLKEEEQDLREFIHIHGDRGLIRRPSP